LFLNYLTFFKPENSHYFYYIFSLKKQNIYGIIKSIQM